MSKLISSCVVAAVCGCATVPKTVSERQSLEARAVVTLGDMNARDPGLHELLAHSVGYAVFPDIGKAGFAVGAAWGRGVLFDHGIPKGFIQLSQGSFGAQVGAESAAELVVFRDRDAIDQLKAGTLEFGADASAIALTTGAAATAGFADGVAVFEVPLGGAMVELSVSGQRLSYAGAG